MDDLMKTIVDIARTAAPAAAAPRDDEELLDIISDALSDAQDYDTCWRDYAKAVLRALRAENLL